MRERFYGTAGTHFCPADTISCASNYFDAVSIVFCMKGTVLARRTRFPARNCFAAADIALPCERKYFYLADTISSDGNNVPAVRAFFVREILFYLGEYDFFRVKKQLSGGR